MNVKEIFAMRKQGRIEEAYEAIRPIYAVHKGRFTTLCMFWVGCDVFKLRLEQKRIEEAEKIYEALKRMLPHVQKIEEEDSKAEPEVAGKQEQSRQKNNASGFMHYAEGRLIKASEKFRKRYFAMRDKKQRSKAQAAATASPDEGRETCDPFGARTQDPNANEGIYNPSDIPSEDPIIPSELSDVIPCVHPVIPSALELRSLATNGTQVVEGSLSKGQQAVLDCIKANPGLKVPGIETETGIPAKSIERHIKVLIARGLIEHRGSKKTGGYHALK